MSYFVKLLDFVRWSGDHYEIFKKIILAIVAIYTIFCICYTSYSLYGLYHNRNSDVSVTTQLGSIRTEQQSAQTNIQSAGDRVEAVTKGLETSITRVDKVSDSIGSVLSGTQSVQAILGDNQQRIDECRRVLEEVRKEK